MKNLHSGENFLMSFLGRLDELCIYGILEFCRTSETRNLAIASRKLLQDVTSAGLGIFLSIFRIQGNAEEIHLPRSLGEVLRMVARVKSEKYSSTFSEVFQVACAFGYFEFVEEQLLTDCVGLKRILVSHKSSTGMTAIHYASANGRVGIVATLITAGADGAARDNKGHDALWYASNGGHYRVIKLLLSPHARPYDPCACMLDVLRNHSLSYPEKASSVVILSEYFATHLSDVMKRLQLDPFDRATVSTVMTESTKLLLAINLVVSTDSTDESSLLSAILNPITASTGLIALIRKTTISSKTCPPIITASSTNNLACIPILLASGVSTANDVSPDSHKSALYVACELGHVAVAKLLLENGALLSQTTSSGRNCLHIAVERDRNEIIELVCEDHCTVADILQPNSGGVSPFILAENRNRKRMVLAMLRAYRSNMTHRAHREGNRVDAFLTKKLVVYAKSLGTCNS
jgi:ankyrin repeat protein